MATTFGMVIKQARKDKGYSQMEIATLLGVSCSYFSKLENDRVDYAPKEDFIRLLAQELNLEEKELIVLAGRLPKKYEAFLQQNYKEMTTLFERLQEDFDFAQKVFNEKFIVDFFVKALFIERLCQIVFYCKGGHMMTMQNIPNIQAAKKAIAAMSLDLQIEES